MSYFDCYLINSFTDKQDGGNPAAVIPLEKWIENDEMQRIAFENGVAETAFFVKGEQGYALKWFTPEIEMDLCGHATLASAFVIKRHINPDAEHILFSSNSGDLSIDVSNDSWITMDFPSRPPKPATVPEVIKESLNIQPREVLKSRDYVLVYESEEVIRAIDPDKELLDRINLDPGGVIVTAQGDSVDFVSRFFTPQSGIMEDPVTGSAHCSLIPYWAEILGKQELLARQISERGGTLKCKNAGARVLISGQCIEAGMTSVNLD